MGTEYSIVRRVAREIYDLGKARHGLPRGMEPLDEADLEPMLGKLSPRERRLVHAGGEGHTAMWLVMGTPDSSVFRLAERDRERIADLLLRASDAVSERDTALLVADDLIAWAGGDELTLVVDEEVETIGHLGFDEEIDHYGRTGGIDRAIARIRGDDR